MYGGLASTGAGGIYLLGHVIGLNYVVATAVGLVLGGIAMVRLASRKGRQALNRA
ncbi:MAG TPA: hypothetical protein VEL02_14255 [Jatrophihabitantaceae bacterium]|jgi:uncharacterized integral membrane protein|nr:hypothetical protein [Jatrophihabitantaceae bacterium]